MIGADDSQGHQNIGQGAKPRLPFPFPEFEGKWQRRWLEEGMFRAANPGEAGFDEKKPKAYILDMFPYPSGEGLHVGHVEGYTATDIVARYKRLCGFNVLHPMGWDAFGLPAEQFAIKTGQHPRVTTERNIQRFREQLQAIGFSYDWSREVSTTDPRYFKWTQWIFLQLYHTWFNPETQRAERIETYKGEDPDQVRLAYVAEVPVNWCPGLGTVLANEEVVDGKSEVGGFPVERRPMRQWMLRITAYAERLIQELDLVQWPESIKLLQRNWIGRSDGAEVTFVTDGGGYEIEVFTTRPDTLFGATYLVLAPEHPLVSVLTTDACKEAVATYQHVVASKSDLERTELSKEKTGVFIGAYAINPVNQERIPIWIADYVLVSYGKGAIMAVPAHDERDFEFAQRFELDVKRVVASDKDAGAGDTLPFSGEGVALNSGFLDELATSEAKEKVIQWLEAKGSGKRMINYKLRDWLFSRQRYWGEPFPIVWAGERHLPLSEDVLPVVQPEMEDFSPTGTPEPPLSKAREWVAFSNEYLRETNTMPQWAGSCWYYLRFCDPENSAHFVGKNAEAYWMQGGVDLYVGGTEHAVLHLLYARFWHKVLFDLGYVSTPEPFHQLVNQGMILGSDGHKMSKSRGNVVNPDEVIAQYGADSLRLYEMFMGPLEQMKPWSMKGVEGVFRFLARVWRLAFDEDQEGQWVVSHQLAEIALTSKQRFVLHTTIKKVGEDIEKLNFNTAIAQMMVFVNEFTTCSPRPVEALRVLVRLLSPFAPHIAEEIQERLRASFAGFEGFVMRASWPTYDPAVLLEEEVEVVLQVNGKLRDRLVVPRTTLEEDLEQVARANAKVAEQLAGKTVVKVIVVPGKLVNFVAK